MMKSRRLGKWGHLRPNASDDAERREGVIRFTLKFHKETVCVFSFLIVTLVIAGLLFEHQMINMKKDLESKLQVLESVKDGKLLGKLGRESVAIAEGEGTRVTSWGIGRRERGGVSDGGTMEGGGENIGVEAQTKGEEERTKEEQQKQAEEMEEGKRKEEEEEKKRREAEEEEKKRREAEEEEGKKKVEAEEKKRKEEEENKAKVEEKKDDRCEEDRLKPGWLADAAQIRLNYPKLDEGLDLNKKYMLYTLCNDYCAGLLHYTSSLWGMMAEARRLNRILVWMPMCIAPHHNRGVLERKDPGVIFDKERIVKEYVTLIEERDFWGRVYRTGSENIIWKKIGPNEKTSEFLEESATVLERDYTNKWNRFVFAHKNDPENNAKNAEIWHAPHLLNLIEVIVKELNNGDYDAVHVRRGDKAKRVKQWPNLEKDTRPERLVEKLPKLVDVGRTLYVASDEWAEGFFDPLKALYELRLQDDFRHHWGEGSKWWEANRAVEGEAKQPTFDTYQRAFVDYSILERAKKRIETFPHLTQDKWYP